MGLVFIASWLVRSVAGWAAFNETRLQQVQDPISWGYYLLNADFWARTLQNWQSEFLAVGAMAVLSIYLRQRGSSQSKPVVHPINRHRRLITTWRGRHPCVPSTAPSPSRFDDPGQVLDGQHRVHRVA